MAASDRPKPLNLLDLPVDVLKEIVKEVTHTNDLTSLALAHSSLHALTIPQIYHRFDIVWPDAHSTADPRTGVDALTYGLATLVMAEDVFGESPSQRVSSSGPAAQSFACDKCGHTNVQKGTSNVSVPAGEGKRKPRRGNHYSQFTRKFSLGNGPPEWVSEYLITKEGGKMLGTLAALAIARMPNLETFVWDMPTGVLRDVWLALASLGDRTDGQEPRLERVWVRWHDNQESAGTGPVLLPPPPPPPLASATSLGFLVPPGNTGATNGLPGGPGTSMYNSHSQSPGRVEHPTFSVLPALRSLSVLDIDELAYLDEMSILIARSKDRLRELRVGISSSSGMPKAWVMPWDGPSVEQVDHSLTSAGVSSIGEKRLGGVLGVLVGRIYDIRRRKRKLNSDTAQAAKNQDPLTASEVAEGPISVHSEAVDAGPSNDTGIEGDSNALDTSVAAVTALEPGMLAPDASDDALVSPPAPSVNLETMEDPDAPAHEEQSSASSAAMVTPSSTEASPHIDATVLSDALNTIDGLTSSVLTVQNTGSAEPTLAAVPSPKRPVRDEDTQQRLVLEGKLKLEVLELERVPLCIPVLQKAFDWSIMTNLTILGCLSSEMLWKMLRQSFYPYAPSKGGPSLRSRASFASSSKPPKSLGPPNYRLRLKKIHTDAVGPALIGLLRETLAPNTLEVLFLQESSSFMSSVSIDAIYRGPLKRHGASLKKLFIDSSIKPRNGSSAVQTSLTSWRKWMFTREVLGFVTSGKMSSLRELGMAVEYKDWHYLLTRLPFIPHLRSLYIPHIADHVYTSPDPKEMALQVLDIVTLRPDMEICYMGCLTKCFEILENRNHEGVYSISDSNTSAANLGPGVAMDDDDDEDSDITEDEDEEEDADDDNGPATTTAGVDSDETDGEELDALDDSDGEGAYDPEDFRSKPKLRLREILFYDDKVAIFKARHGKL